MTQQVNRWLAALLLGVLSTLAAAHGTDQHGKDKSAAANKTQQPWGIAGDAKAAARTINISMTDNMRFVPDHVDVRLGETVKFVIRNEGAMLHEMVIGTRKELDRHAALMLKFPDMQHDEPFMAHVPAGQTGEIRWRFNRAGSFEFACLIAGHYQAGMKGSIKVSRAPVSERKK